MRHAAIAGLVVSLSLFVLADDKVGKTQAPQLLQKTVTELRKSPGYHFKYSGSVGQYSLDTTGIWWSNGLVKQVTGAGVEIWRREKASFAKDANGKYVGAASLGQEVQAVVNSPTPDQLLVEALGVAKVAKYAQDAEAADKECKVIECEAPQQKLREYIEAAAKYWRPEYAAFAKSIQLNEKESYMIYRVYVSKDDLVVRQVVRETKVVLADSVTKGRPELAAVNGQLDQVLTAVLERHGEGLDEEIPAEIKKLLQVK